MDSSRLNTCVELPESLDIHYETPPKSVSLWVDATKWVVGLATGSFFLAAVILTDPPSQPLQRILAGSAIALMVVAAAFGVRALQIYIRLANLIEMNAARKPVEVEHRCNDIEMVRWVTKERAARCADFKESLASANWAYRAMTICFALGLLLYLLHGAASLFELESKAEALRFESLVNTDGSMLGAIYDSDTQTHCVVVRLDSKISCEPLDYGD